MADKNKIMFTQGRTPVADRVVSRDHNAAVDRATTVPWLAAIAHCLVRLMPVPTLVHVAVEGAVGIHVLSKSEMQHTSRYIRT